MKLKTFLISFKVLPLKQIIFFWKGETPILSIFAMGSKFASELTLSKPSPFALSFSLAVPSGVNISSATR